jgi:hypothetical protein
LARPARRPKPTTASAIPSRNSRRWPSRRRHQEGRAAAALIPLQRQTGVVAKAVEVDILSGGRRRPASASAGTMSSTSRSTSSEDRRRARPIDRGCVSVTMTGLISPPFKMTMSPCRRKVQP